MDVYKSALTESLFFFATMITIIVTIQILMNVRWMTVSVPAMVQMLSASTLMGAMSAPVNKATEIMILSVKVSHKGILILGVVP